MPDNSRTKPEVSMENICTSRFWILFQVCFSLGQNSWHNSFACNRRTEGPSPLWALRYKTSLPSCAIELPIWLFVSPKSSREKVSRVSLLATKVLHNVMITAVTFHHLHYTPFIINKSQIPLTLQRRGLYKGV